MDDSLERPTATSVDLAKNEDEDEQSSGDEDGTLDWTKLQITARPVIPRRGEKEFEPKPGGGSGLQQHILDSARDAMFDVLRTTRTTSSKAISYAIWHPGIARAHVTVAKGIHFTSMGHSVPRLMVGKDGVERVQKRLELLPEETIYLVERGSLFCWKECNDHSPDSENTPGVPMSVQQVYSEMIGLEDLTLEKFQVFAYLKRLGYAVTRAKPPNDFYPSPPPHILTKTTSTYTVMQRICSIFPLLTSSFSKLFSRAFDWWKPIRISRWFLHDKNYGFLYRSMRFLNSGHKVALEYPNTEKRNEDKKNSPYQIFFNLYKPSTPFKKSAPPQPDFQIVVVNARTTPMPTLHELTDLFDVLPELPPPLPRKRQPLMSGVTAASQGNLNVATIPAPEAVATPTSGPALSSSGAVTVTPPVATPSQIPPQLSLFHRLFPWFFSQVQPVGPARKPNPFMALKAGKKIIVIAAVDAGSISFFRFGQGEFTEWPMA